MLDEPCSHCARRSKFQAVGLGVAAGVATAATLLLGRKVATVARNGQGHPLKNCAVHVRIAGVEVQMRESNL